MSIKPILSVVVPTKNRHYYLKFLVQYFILLKSAEIELIIHDNSDNEQDQRDFADFLLKADDPRIIYTHVGTPLSVIQNSDSAVRNATGEYVLFIGDDDIFSKHLLELLKQAIVLDIDAILPVKASYSWPDVRFRNSMLNKSGSFKQTKVSGKIKKINSRSVLSDVLHLGGTEILNLPRLYHGVVKRAVLEKVFNDTGSYFPGPSPDIANAVALTKYIKSFIEIDIPYVVSGHSSKSTGGQGAQGMHIGEIRAIKHLPADTADKWDRNIPFYWSGYTIYAESVVQALSRIKMTSELAAFNYNYLYAACFVFDSGFKKRIANVVRQNSRSSYANIFLYYCKIWLNRLRFHGKNFLVQTRKPDANNNMNLALDNILEVGYMNDKSIAEFLSRSGNILANEH